MCILYYHYRVLTLILDFGVQCSGQFDLGNNDDDDIDDDG